MQPTVTHGKQFDGTRALLVPTFILLTYFGNVTVGITVPLAVILIPVLLMSDWPKSIPQEILLLLVMAGVVVAQPLLGVPTVPRADWVIFLPIFYASLTLIALGGTRSRPGDRQLLNSISLGCLLVIVLGIVHLVTGEVSLARRYADDPAPWTYYDFKSMATTPLGNSNYLAAFMMFVVNVGLYARKPLIAVIASVAVVATLSRFGLLFLMASWLLWFAYRLFGARMQDFALCLGGALVLLIVGVGASGLVPNFDLAFAERSKLWAEGVSAFLASPMLGQTRSSIIAAFNVPITWNPHNSVLQLLAFTGLIGAGAYFTYVVIGIRAMRRQAEKSETWRGIYVGMAIFLVWGLVEIISMTPAFELLFATMVGLAHKPSCRYRQP